MFAIAVLLLTAGLVSSSSGDYRKNGDVWVTINCPTGWTVSAVTSKCYKVFNEEVSFDVASAKCRSYDAALVSVHSAFESTEIYSAGKAFSPMVPMWLGLTYSPTYSWAWEDGTPYDFSAWRSGNPVNPQPSSCTTFDNFVSGGAVWNNQYDCDKNAIFACVKEHAINCQDILFILDRSNSINVNDYNTNVRNFISTYAKNILFAESDQVIFSRIGVIEFDSKEVYTIPMIGRSRAEFEDKLKLLAHRQKPESRSADALNMAVRVLRRNHRPEHGATVIFIADGMHNVGKDPVPYTTELRDLGANVFIVALNGTSMALNGYAQKELQAMAGGLPDRYKPMSSPTLIDPKTAENLAFAAGCPALEHRTCRTMLFLFEETNATLATAKMFLDAVKLTGSNFKGASTTFQLITYGSKGQATAIGKVEDDFNAFQKNVNTVASTLPKTGPPDAYLAEGLRKTCEQIEESRTDNEFSKVFVVIIGQAGVGRIADRDELPFAASKLLDLTSTVYVGDISQNGMDFSIWPSVVGQGHNNRIRQYGFSKDAATVADGLKGQLQSDFDEIVCPA